MPARTKRSANQRAAPRESSAQQSGRAAKSKRVPPGKGLDRSTEAVIDAGRAGTLGNASTVMLFRMLLIKPAAT